VEASRRTRLGGDSGRQLRRRFTTTSYIADSPLTVDMRWSMTGPQKLRALVPYSVTDLTVMPATQLLNHATPVFIREAAFD
jgi:hypothetical protein